MAKLINCKLCKSEMSSNATKCPKCGEKNNQRTSPVAWALLLVILYFLYIVLTGTPTKTSTVQTQTYNQTYKAEDYLYSRFSSKEEQTRMWNSMSSEEQDKVKKEIKRILTTPKKEKYNAEDFLNTEHESDEARQKYLNNMSSEEIKKVNDKAKEIVEARQRARGEL